MHINRRVKAEEIKAALLCYYRYTRNSVCATEVWSFGDISDVLVKCNNQIIDIEVKINKNDLINDFKTKNKHKFLNNEFSYINIKHIPNKFYFCVPNDMKDFTKDIINKQNKKIGLLTYNPNKIHILSKSISYIKKAKELNNNICSEHLYKNLIKRMSSEICILRRSKVLKEHNLLKEESSDQLWFEGLI